MSEISCSIQVCTERGQTTMQTGKATIQASANLPTAMADLRSHIRLHFIDSNTKPLRFVSHKRLKLIKTPAMQPIIQFPASLLSPDAFQILNHNPATAIEGSDYPLAYVVVYPSHKPIFSATDCFEQSLCSTSAFGLQFTMQIPESALCLFDFGRAEETTIRCDGNVIYADINAKNSALQVRDFCIDIFGKTKQEKASSFPVNPKQTSNNLPLISEIMCETGRDFERNFLPAFDGCDAQNITFEGCAAWKVIANANSLDYWLALCLLNHSARLLNASNSQLSRQCFPKMSIDKRMQFNIIPYLMLCSSIDAELQCFRISFESGNYFWSRLDFDFCGCPDLHIGMETDRLFKLYVVMKR
jgi:hypothetical protein